MYLEILSYIQDKEKRLRDHEEIFFKTAKIPLNTENERQNLFAKYGAPYIKNWPDYVFFACDEKTGRTMGYLTGCPNTLEAESILVPVQKTYPIIVSGKMWMNIFRRWKSASQLSSGPYAYTG